MKPPKKDTSWEHVAQWYDAHLEGEGTYQKELILPNLLRLMDLGKKDAVLDLACGQGFFAREFAKFSPHVLGVDASRSLVALAEGKQKEGSNTSHASHAPLFRVADADKLPFVSGESIDKIAVVLALQNMENINGVLRECARVLKKGGQLFIVLNHPAFRVPKESSWGWDEKAKVQYRRVDRYLSELKVPIDMHPGSKESEKTISFHRPLQFYFKAFHKAGFTVAGLEEWNSHKKSEVGPRSAAEDLARKEIPLFLAIIAAKP